jgi:glycosyltransferase involved in cell wall biosynthesis
MKIAIIGTRGIPNHYGGFEQFAEYLAKGLVKRGHDITVYNSHSHPYQKSEWNGVKLVHCNDPEDKWGTIGQFVYDLNCIKHTRSQSYDIILQLGYTSSTVWGWMLPREKSIITTNMDGLEWKRSKYSKSVRAFLKKAEYLGTVFSDYWISDSLGIQDYLTKEYNISSTYIPYGAHPFETPNANCLYDYDVSPGSYNMLIARLEPENNVDTILEGASQSYNQAPFLVVGKHNTKFGEYLKTKYVANKNIRFLGGIYDINVLNNVRHFANIYFHGHSVGGTNPSLLEAMASHTLICAHKNEFNSTILEDDALYFSNSEQVKAVIDTSRKEDFKTFADNNVEKIRTIYEWDNIIDQYENHFNTIYSTKHEVRDNNTAGRLPDQPKHLSR